MKKKILIVDDSKEIMQLLAKILEDYFDVFQAADGQEGVEIIVKHRPNLVITDLVMPQMRGEEVLRYITKNNLSIRTIVLSEREELEPVARAAGCDAFFLKPFDLFALREEVKRLLGEEDKK